jgi:hypothetical protein
VPEKLVDSEIMMKPKDAEEILDEIRHASRFRHPKSVDTSTVDRLISSHWCNEEDLILAYNDLQNPDLDRVVVLFQLPFLMRLPDKWLKVRSEYGHPYIRFRTSEFAHSRTDTELTTEISEKPKRSQVLMSYQLWDRRRKLYIPYLEALNEPREVVKTKLKSSGFLNAVEFEQDLVKRVRLQTIQVLRDFIPTYRVICKDPFAFPPERVDRFFMMVKNGKVVIRDEITGAVTPQDKELQPIRDYSRNFTDLRNRLKEPWRPSIYETYLLEAARQVELGACNLAMVQIVMILDWFANEIIENHLIRKMRGALDFSPGAFDLTSEYLWEDERGRIVPSTEEKYLKYFPVIGISLTSKLVGDLREMIKHRNRIVHRSQAAPVDPAVALNTLEASMSIVRHCMDSLLKKNKRASDRQSPNAVSESD